MQAFNSAIKSLTITTRTALLTRALHSSTSLKMPIKVGDSLPSVELFEGTPGNKVNIADLGKGKKIVIVGVPGAFTPSCDKTHLPGYIDQAGEIKAKGIAEIICVSVNDPFVMAAWGTQQKADGKVRMLADTNGDFTRAIDLEHDLAAVLGTKRCKRFAMLVDDGKVKAVDVEPDGTGLSCSLSNNFIKAL